MKQKKVIVIGAGVAGLSCAIHLLQAGFDVSVFEKNETVGGLCNGYYVDGFYVDACLHWLMGTKEKTTVNDVWRNVGGLGDDVPIISLPTLGEFVYEGTHVFLYRDLDQTEASWLKISPEDEVEIRKFFNCVRELVRMTNLSQASKKILAAKDGFVQMVKGLSTSPEMLAAMNQSREEYAKRFKHPALRFTIINGQTGYNDMLFFMVQYAFFVRGDADVPEGGAFYMMDRVKNRFVALGGHLYLNTPVDEILVEGLKTTGVVAGGKKFKADYVVSAVDPKYTLDTLLHGKHKSMTLTRLHKNVDAHSISSCFAIYIAIDADLSEMTVPTCIHVPAIRVGITDIDSLLVRHYGFDPKYFVKDGKTVASIFINQDQNDYAFWATLDEEAYKAEMQRVVDESLQALEEAFPQFKGKIHLVTRFGPIELKQQTNTEYGALLCFSLTNMKSAYQLTGKIASITNLYFASQWNRSIGGTPTALLFGQSIAKKIIRTDRITSAISSTFEHIQFGYE